MDFAGTLVRAIDGDTVVLKLTKTYQTDIGFRIIMDHTATTEQHLRLVGINTPEIEGEQKTAGLKAKAALEALLSGKDLKVTTYKPDKYGRFLVDILVGKTNASLFMIEKGFASPYDGHGVKPIPA